MKKGKIIEISPKEFDLYKKQMAKEIQAKKPEVILKKEMLRNIKKERSWDSPPIQISDETWEQEYERFKKEMFAGFENAKKQEHLLQAIEHSPKFIPLGQHQSKKY